MNQDFQCTKIKDGLYISNVVVAHDYQFLISNKFAYIVNCTAQIPNVFQSYDNIQYLKFKLIPNKPHKLWDETLKKLNKLQKFITQAQTNSLCVLIHSFHGQNRSLVFVVAYLMKKYQWRLKKCLQYVKSKEIFIGLSGHYITQLQILENILSKQSNLTISWLSPYFNQDDQIMSKTFLNSLQYNRFAQISGKLNILDKKQNIKKQKRVVWLDRLQKKKRKQIQISKKQPQNNQKLQKQQIIKQSIKIKQSTSTHLMNHNIKKRQTIDNKIMNEQNKKDQQNKDKNIYQLTINNFISPNFNIINKSQPLLKKVKNQDKDKDKDKDKEKEKEKRQKSSKNDRSSKLQKDKQKNDKEKKRPASAKEKSKKNDKMNRAKSQKEVEIIQNNKEKQKKVKLTHSVQGQKKQFHLSQKQIKNQKKDIKKELKKQLEKAQKEKSSHSVNSLHLLYLTKSLHKRNSGSTPTKKQRKVIKS